LTRTQRHIEEYRQGDACIQVRDAAGRPCRGIPISVEQESHQFLFGCVVPDLGELAEAERQLYRARLDEVFNSLVPAALPEPLPPNVLRVDVAERIHLGLLRHRLDHLAASGFTLHVHVWGQAAGMTETADSAGPSERDVGRRVAALYTLCFGHPSVDGVFWNGFADGEGTVRDGGLLRRDLAPKYAHKVLQKLIGSLWHSRAAGVTDAEGRFGFRGFFGNYRVVATTGEPHALVKTVTLHRGSTGTVLCTLTPDP
jgi:hypothetical protein